MIYLHKIYKSGNSLAVSIPAEMVNKLGLTAGQIVEVKIDYQTKCLHIKFPHALQLPLIKTTK